MEPLRALETAARKLGRIDCRFAVAGGLASNFFRAEPRLTQDVDLLLLADPPGKTLSVAKTFLQDLGFTIGLAHAADLKRGPMRGKRTTPIVMVVGRRKGKEIEGGVDILLPAMEWVPQAVERAQNHRIDYGFARLPTITAEDFILAKAFALRDNPTRFKDMDDLKSIFEARIALDFVYLVREIERFHLPLPQEIRNLAPKPLRRAFRGR